MNRAPLLVLGGLVLFVAVRETVAQAAIADFFIVERGDVPILITSPHGGTEVLPDVSERSSGNTIRDVNTDLLASALSDHLEALGHKPYLAVALGHRKYIDFNRPKAEAYEDPDAEPYYDYYHASTVRQFVDEISARWGRGILLDIHGQGAEKLTIFRGTQDGATFASYTGEALTGTASIFGTLKSLHYNVHPDPLDGPEDGRYRGGFTVRAYGTMEPDGIDAMQLEYGSELRFDDAWQRSAVDLAFATNSFYVKHVPEPSSWSLVGMGMLLVATRLRKGRDSTRTVYRPHGCDGTYRGPYHGSRPSPASSVG